MLLTYFLNGSTKNDGLFPLKIIYSTGDREEIWMGVISCCAWRKSLPLAKSLGSIRSVLRSPDMGMFARVAVRFFLSLISGPPVNVEHFSGGGEG
ncbi:MAG: hypothetical protein HW407_1299 [Bacteroidetes bacterium]|nr:hypothetical protein [Bacteroidota bacterium]